MATPAVTTITSTVEATIVTEIPVRYWAFEMEVGDEHCTYSEQWPYQQVGESEMRWDMPEPYWLVTREVVNDRDRGHRVRLYADFYSHEGSAIEDLSADDDDAGDLADLSIPWTIFAAGVRRILSGTKQATMGGYGGFVRDEPGYVVYTTNCGQHYRLTDEVLEGLLTE